MRYFRKYGYNIDFLGIATNDDVAAQMRNVGWRETTAADIARDWLFRKSTDIHRYIDGELVAANHPFPVEEKKESFAPALLAAFIAAVLGLLTWCFLKGC